MSEPAIIAERRNAAWTPGEDAQLLERRKSGDPVSVIAALLKRPVPAVYARAIKLGSKVIERKTWTEAEDARLRSLVLTAGLNNRLIAESMGIRHSAVCWRIRQLKLTGVRPVPVTPACK
ncbi:hypothetical protein, partial [Pararhodobacter sp.]|uniref:hypothetical protein n=1 Tax=Pararhodobacter sp. TaxID=2127056 RepID=UPI002FDDC029